MKTTRSCMCGRAIPEKDKKENALSRKTKEGHGERKWLRKWPGLQWFKLCDIWFHGDSFNECQRTKDEKRNSLPRMQRRRPGQLRCPCFQGSVCRGSAGPAGGLPLCVSLISTSRVSVGRRGGWINIRVLNPSVCFVLFSWFVLMLWSYFRIIPCN